MDENNTNLNLTSADTVVSAEEAEKAREAAAKKEREEKAKKAKAARAAADYRRRYFDYYDDVKNHGDGRLKNIEW